jgi:hypothetical protein
MPARSTPMGMQPMDAKRVVLQWPMARAQLARPFSTVDALLLHVSPTGSTPMGMQSMDAKRVVLQCHMVRAQLVLLPTPVDALLLHVTQVF